MPGSGKRTRRIPGSGYGEHPALRPEGAQFDPAVLIRLTKKQAMSLDVERTSPPGS
jgi:hypothetical protein